MCYGRARGVLPRAQSATVSLPDVWEFGYSEERTRRGCRSSISEVVDNLRYERYHYHRPGARQNGRMSLTNSVYYLVRPVLPVAVRKHLQKGAPEGMGADPVPAVADRCQRRRGDAELDGADAQEQGLTRIPFIWFWPEGVPSCGIMTHDVEGPEGRDFCDQLMDMNDACGDQRPRSRSSRKTVHVARRVPRAASQPGGSKSTFTTSITTAGCLSQRSSSGGGRRQINAYGRKFGSRGFRSGAMYREQQWFDASGVLLRHVGSERCAPRTATRRLLHADAILHRQDRRASR